MAEFEERADQLSLETIDASLANGQIFSNARQKLLAKGAKLLIGPRGTGKTHLMRYTYKHALNTPKEPLALYATFNRYLNLEPLLIKFPDARQRFHSWVIAKLLLSAFDYLSDQNEEASFLIHVDPFFDAQKLRNFVSLIERGVGLEVYEEFGQYLTIDHVLKIVQVLCDRFSRKRAVLLLDDAALSLAEPYLIAFFEIFRLLKTEFIAPKASVYPGSTQYGPTFHASHEAEEVHLWLSVEDAEYLQIMGEIATRRLPEEEIQTINPDIFELLKYLSFGIPRTFLRLLREYLDDNAGSSQKKINKIISRQTELIGAEYDSLGLKLAQFSSLVQTGRKLFDKAVKDVSEVQSADATNRNIILGIRHDGRTPLADRMLKFLIEVGLVYPMQAVSHGANRKYDRFIPHLAFLYQHGAFREGKSAWAKGVSLCMQRPASKHPVRRDLSTLLTSVELARLKLDLPTCENCGAQRINESQKFCHECGKELVAASLFEACMKLPLEDVPGISDAMIKRIHSDTKFRSIGHVYGSQNAYGELQQANYVGPVRANDILNKVTLSVNEFLS